MHDHLELVDCGSPAGGDCSLGEKCLELHVCDVKSKEVLNGIDLFVLKRLFIVLLIVADSLGLRGKESWYDGVNIS